MNDAFEIESRAFTSSRSRNTRTEVATIRFRPLEEQARPDLVLPALIERLLDRVLHGLPPPLRVGLQLQPPSFAEPFVVPLRPLQQNNPAALAAAIERLNEQSGAGINLLNGETQTRVYAVWPLGVNLNDGQQQQPGGK